MVTWIYQGKGMKIEPSQTSRELDREEIIKLSETIILNKNAYTVECIYFYI